MEIDIHGKVFLQLIGKKNWFEVNNRTKNHFRLYLLQIIWFRRNGEFQKVPQNN